MENAVSSTVPSYDHIVVVVEENHGFNQIIGNLQLPYINLLANSGSILAQYFAITHPSQPNYFALYAGSTFGADNGHYLEPDPTLATILQDSGKTFVGYSEPATPARHTPWVSFPEGTTVARDIGAFPTDFSLLPTVSFVVPDLANSGHDGDLPASDQWLQSHLDTYARWAPTHNSLLVIVWDEDDFSGANRVPAILYGANINLGIYDDYYTHYDLLSMLLGASGLSGPNGAATAAGIGNGVFYNVLTGNAGDDALTGGSSNFALYGYAGNDVLTPGDGNNALYGGAGFDEAILLLSHGGFTSNTFNPQTGAGTLSGSGRSEVVSGIEAIAFTELQHGGPFDPAAAQFADVNGDGRADLIYQGFDNQFWLATATGNGLSAITAPVTAHGGGFVAGEAQYADVTGDGRADLIYQGLDNRFWLATATGNGFAAIDSPVVTHGGGFVPGEAQYADVTGDGRADLIYQGFDNRFWLATATGNGFVAITTPVIAHGGGFVAGEAQYADVTGDGRADLIYQGLDNRFWLATATGNGFAAIDTPVITHGGGFVAGGARYADVTGDGRSDLIYQDLDNRFWLGIATGTGFNDITTPVASFEGSFAGGSAHYADLNNDGKADLVFQDSDKRVWAALSNGSGFGASQQIAHFPGNPLLEQLHTVDGQR